ncbi:YbjN domain-containing protein [Blastomonas sp. AAP53]|uniref:YbjN domain-containing protein n=1 Tax=Blastomonas sp. AAP53 TaxID=1248760 RepID=UPI00031CD425|nr:YbjN domain-containing protein [Blastomonas sp. AAP53]
MSAIKSALFGIMALTAGLNILPAHAQNVTATIPDSIAAVLQARGLPSELKRGEGNPYIRSAYDDMPFLVALMNCDDDKTNCATVQFYFGFNDKKDFPLEKLNEWNATKRFVRAYRDDENDPVLVMDVDTDKGGVPQAVFNENLSVWLDQMQQYRRFVTE